MGRPLKVRKDRRPTKGAGAGCLHTDGLPCWRAIVYGGDMKQPWSYHWTSEDGAVMFAMRHTRNNDYIISVISPDGFRVTEFEGRKHTPPAPSPVGDIWNDLAEHARKRKAPPKKQLKKIVRKSK